MLLKNIKFLEELSAAWDGGGILVLNEFQSGKIWH